MTIVSKGVDCTIIDDQLIIAAVKDNLRELQETEIDDVPGLYELATLNLSFRNIHKIDNLVCLENLVQLKLDNNVIYKIENLDHFAKLKWLDLSFNNIQKIEGLENLRNVTDLSLSDNDISHIENLDSLSKLQVLSLANNSISNVDEIKYMRQFKALRCVNLKGNPICEQDEFETFVMAFLKNIQYLNFKRIEEEDLIRAREEQQTELLELEDQEKRQENHEAELMEEEKQRKVLSSANLLGTDTLSEDIMERDSEISKLRKLPGFQSIEANHQRKLKKQADQFNNEVLRRFEQKKRERQLFDGAAEKLKKENNGACRGLVDELETFYKKMKLSDEVKITQTKVDEISTIMMDLEVKTKEKIEDRISEFENRMTKIKDDNLSASNSFFRGIEDYEAYYQKELVELVTALLEQAAAGEIPDDDPGLTALVNNKDTLMTAINSSQDNHVSWILKLEETFNELEIASYNDMLNELREQEYRRNRCRVSETFDMIERYKE